MWLQLPPFEPVLVLNSQFVLIKGILCGCKLLAVLEEAIDCDGHKDSVGHTSHQFNI